MILINISGIEYESVVDGEGIRNALFVSGCYHKCLECHNSKTWDFNYGYEFTKEVQDEFISKCKDNVLLDGITLSGGDPMYLAKELIPFIRKYKRECPNQDVWIYSGFTHEEILKDENMNELLNLCDILVDGVYKKELRDVTLQFRGSSNQRIIKIK